MQPTVRLINPWIDPPSTFRASNVSQMYEVSLTPEISDIVYNIGLGSISTQFTLKIRNKTVSNALEVVIEIPKYMSTPSSTIEIPPDNTATVFLNLNESFIRQYVESTVDEIKSEVKVTVIPQNVTGPVYVLTT